MTERKSGYDPETGICWNFNNTGESRWHWDHRKSCPVCSADSRQLAMFGRCRSGRRWFWAVSLFDRETEPVHGFEDTEELATAAAIKAVRTIKNQRFLNAVFKQGIASDVLKKLNEAKQRQRPASDAKDARSIDHLYSHEGCYSDGWPCECQKLTGAERILYHTQKFQILKTTKKRVYYNRTALPFFDDDKNPNIRDLTYYGTGYVDRLKLEAEGEVYNHGQHWSANDHHLYLSVEHLLSSHRHNEDRQPKPDLAALKAEMAAAHPDRGGSNEAFIAARSRYVEARRSMAHHHRHRREGAGAAP